MTDFTHVAVGVIRNSSGEVLLARRPDHVHQGGLWEFPGGKVEAGESLQQALARELKEELGIEIDNFRPLIQVRHEYADKNVLLDVCEVREFRGEPRGNEGQPLRWVAVNALGEPYYPLPAANAPILKALHLPDQLMITGEFESWIDFESRLEQGLAKGIKLVQFRVAEEFDRELLEAARQRGHRYDTKLVVNTGFAKGEFLDEGFYAEVADWADGVHLPTRQLMNLEQRPLRPHKILGASCHNVAELTQAERLDVDYAFLSPVLATASHSHATPLGWERFGELCTAVNVPIYALGGLSAEHITQAKTQGGQGIAAIMSLWEQGGSTND